MNYTKRNKNVLTLTLRNNWLLFRADWVERGSQRNHHRQAVWLLSSILFMYVCCVVCWHAAACHAHVFVSTPSLGYAFLSVCVSSAVRETTIPLSLVTYHTCERALLSNCAVDTAIHASYCHSLQSVSIGLGPEYCWVLCYDSNSWYFQIWFGWQIDWLIPTGFLEEFFIYHKYKIFDSLFWVFIFDESAF